MFLGIPGLAHVGDRGREAFLGPAHILTPALSKHLFSPQHIFPEPHVVFWAGHRNQEMYNQGPFSQELTA